MSLKTFYNKPKYVLVLKVGYSREKKKTRAVKPYYVHLKIS